MSAPALAECRYCEQVHGPRILCDPARRVLDALIERGQRFDMPVVEFPDPIDHSDMFGADTVLVAGLVVKAALNPVAGHHPAPYRSSPARTDAGRSRTWLYCASPRDMKRVMQLVTEMGTMAIRRARGAA